VSSGDVAALNRLRQPEPAQEHPGAGSAYPWDEQVPPPGGDATLLAVVPIPGTGTSLAIVGYVITTSAIPAAPGPEPSPGHQPSPSHQPSPGHGLRMDHGQRRVWIDGREILLTFQEFELLAFLAAHPATVFTRAELVEQVWRHTLAQDGRPVPRDSRTVDVHVSRVRHKLGPRFGQCLVTEYRVGYQYRPLDS
jgi:hypothetical protein